MAKIAPKSQFYQLFVIFKENLIRLSVS